MNYNPALDGIRAIAVMSVLAFHAKVAMPGGWLGVDVFFVLSGYLITSLLAADQGYRPIDFYVRRMRRLYPALVAFLIAYLCLAPLMWPEYPFRNVIKGVLLGGLYVNSYTYDDYGGPNYVAQLWSLAVEVHYYLIWGLVLPLILKSRHRVAIVFSMAMLASAARFAEAPRIGFDDAYHFTHLRLSGLLFGSWLALLLLKVHVSERNGNVVGLVSMPALVYVLGTETWQSTNSLTVGVMKIELFTMGVIVWAQNQPSLLANPVMRKIGLYSYGMYLWHYPLMRWLRGSIPPSEVFAIASSFALVMSMLSYHTIERPFRRKRKEPALSTIGEGST